MSKITSFEDLTVWQKAHQLILRIYKLTADFPSEERFGLVSQMRRASISITANIAEGFKRRGAKDKINFYNIAQGSLTELQNYLILTKDLGYFSDKHYDEFCLSAVEISKMLNSLISSIRSAPKP